MPCTGRARFLWISPGVWLVVLAPKTLHYTKAGQLRVLNMMETVHKVYASILIKRLLDALPLPRHQLGGLPGGQPLHGLMAATGLMACDHIYDNSHIWLSLDVSAAFDSLAWSSILAALSQTCSP